MKSIKSQMDVMTTNRRKLPETEGSAARAATARILSFLFLSVPILVASARAEVPALVEPSAVMIAEVFADAQARTIEIHGDGFGSQGNSVTLGFNELFVIGSSDSHISARLPQRFSSGSYLLTVERPGYSEDCSGLAQCPPVGRLLILSSVASLGVTIAGAGSGRSQGSQALTAPAASRSNSLSPPMGAWTLELAMGQSVEIDGLGIELLQVVEDSRCATDLTCVWAGRVTVALGLWQERTYLGEFLLTLGEAASAAQVEIGNHRIELSGVLPVPSTDIMPIDPADYSVILQVTAIKVQTCEGGVWCPPVE